MVMDNEDYQLSSGRSWTDDDIEWILDQVFEQERSMFALVKESGKVKSTFYTRAPRDFPAKHEAALKFYAKVEAEGLLTDDFKAETMIDIRKEELRTKRRMYYIDKFMPSVQRQETVDLSPQIVDYAGLAGPSSSPALENKCDRQIDHGDD